MPGPEVKDVSISTSFDEADRADREYYRSLSPEERLEILFELVERYRESLGEAERRLARVCRVVEFPPRE